MTPSGIQPEVDAIKAAQQKIATAQKTANVPASKQFTFTKVEAPSATTARTTAIAARVERREGPTSQVSS